MTTPIPLWAVITPYGEPIIESLHHTPHGATYRFGAANGIPLVHRQTFWETRRASGYQVQKFNLEEEVPEHG